MDWGPRGLSGKIVAVVPIPPTITRPKPYATLHLKPPEVPKSRPILMKWFFAAQKHDPQSKS